MIHIKLKCILTITEIGIYYYGLSYFHSILNGAYRLTQFSPPLPPPRTPSSSKSKRANWKHLQKHFQRRSFSLSEDELEGLVLSRSGFIVPFLCRCYNHLTGRTCKLPPIKPEVPPEPTFMKSTASHKVRQTLKSESEDYSDRRYMESKAQRALDEHNEELDATRTKNAMSNQFNSLRQTKVLRGTETRPVGHSNVLPKIITRKVKVKQVDQASIAQLRLKHFSKEAKVKSPAARDIPKVESFKRTVPVVVGRSEDTKVEEKSTDDTLESSVLSYFGAVVRPKLSNEMLKVCQAVVNCEDDVIESVALVIKRRKMSYFELVSFLFKAMLTLCDDDFEIATLAASRLGNATDIDVSVFCDYAMPLASFQRLLKSSKKRRATISVLKSFVSSQNTLEFLQRLKFEIDEDEIFITTLANMIETDALQGKLDENEKDMILCFYTDHCEIALKSENPHVFASGISMLGSIAECRRQFSSDRLNVVEKACSHKSAHVRAQAYVTTATLIPCFDVPSPEHDQLSNFVMEKLKSEDCEKTRRLAVMHILTVVSLELAEYGNKVSNGDAMAILLRWCLTLLLEMSADSRASCLSAESQTIEIDDVCFDAPVMVKSWDPCSIVSDVAQNITDQKHDFIEPEYMEVVAAAVVNSTEGLDRDKEQWKTAFASSGLRDYVFVAMCDPECCNYAIRMLHTFVNGPDTLRDLVLKADALVGAIRLLFSPDSESDVLSQKAVIAFFEAGIMAESVDVANGMKTVLRAARSGLNLTEDLAALYEKIE